MRTRLRLNNIFIVNGEQFAEVRVGKCRSVSITVNISVSRLLSSSLTFVPKIISVRDVMARIF